MTRIKLCGFTRKKDAAIANELEVDYVGFVFVPNRKRYVSYSIAREIRRVLKPNIKTVGVFVDEKIEVVADLLEQGVIDLAQLHGKEDEDYIRALKRRTGKPVIKAFQIKTEYDIREAEISSADFVLLDSGIGGTGTVFDWSLIKFMKRAYFLAGGLNPDNVSEAISKLQPYGVDVSSGVETDGRKDRDKIVTFVEAVRKEHKS